MSLEKFISIFEVGIEAVEPNTISPKTRYRELKAWDSLAVLTVTDAIEIEYGVLLNKEHFAGAETVEGLYHHIQKSSGAG